MIPRSITLVDDTILLRPLEIADIPEITEAIQESIPEISAWMGWCTPEYDEAASRTFIAAVVDAWESGSQYVFAITDPQTNRYLGTISLNHIHQTYRLANLGYWVRTSETGRGVATRAARLIARFGFEQLGLLRAEIVVAVGNQPSLRVAEKTGAKREGVLRNRLIIREKVLDGVMHSLTPQDFGLSLPTLQSSR
jgi:RimJ/RimL family protein N-acetyltransferase